MVTQEELWKQKSEQAHKPIILKYFLKSVSSGRPDYSGEVKTQEQYDAEKSKVLKSVDVLISDGMTPEKAHEEAKK